jgi:predicted peptidase
MARRFFAAVLAAVLAVPVVAADPKTGFVDKLFKNDDGTESPYVVFVPHDYDGTKEVPVILFLHGAGETKGGSKKPVEVGIGPAIKKREKTFPFLVVIPQAEYTKTPIGQRWHADKPDGIRAVKMLEATQKEYKTDPARVYLTGLSMGGFGTWNQAIAAPDKWAAIVPVCGGGDPEKAEKIKDLPTWNFHGDKDTAVKVDLSRDMIKALEKAGGKPKYTEYPGVGHNSWDAAYGTDDLYTWLLEQKRK